MTRSCHRHQEPITRPLPRSANVPGCRSAPLGGAVLPPFDTPLESVVPFEIESFYWNQLSATLVIKARLRAAVEITAACGQWRFPMTTHSDHPMTDTENAAFDATMKIMGVIVVLAAIAGIALWYIYS